MSVQVLFPAYLDTRELGEGVHILLRPFYALVEIDGVKYDITIAEGFKTDFCSVPRIPFAYLMFGGIANYAGVLHDGGYSTFEGVRVTDLQTLKKVDFDRIMWDQILKAAVMARGIPAWKASLMYWGVRLKGWQYFRTGKFETLPVGQIGIAA